MATEESFKFLSCEGHTKCTVIYGAIHSKRNQETSWATPTHRENEKIPTSKQAGMGQWLYHSLLTVSCELVP